MSLTVTVRPSASHSVELSPWFDMQVSVLGSWLEMKVESSEPLCTSANRRLMTDVSLEHLIHPRLQSSALSLTLIVDNQHCRHLPHRSCRCRRRAVLVREMILQDPGGTAGDGLGNSGTDLFSRSPAEPARRLCTSLLSSSSLSPSPLRQ